MGLLDNWRAGLGAILAEFGLLWAQASDPLSGGAGWVGAGLLGLVLGWLLLKHLPENAKTMRELSVDHGKALKDLGQAHVETVKEVVGHCQREARLEREASERRHQEALALLGKIHEGVREGVHATRNLDNALRVRNRLAEALQSAEVPAWTKSLDGTLMSWNAAAERVLGWRQGEVVGRSIYETLVPPEHHGAEREVLRRIAAGETLEEYETERQARNGRRVPLVVVTSPIRDQAGRVVGASTIAREA